MDFQSLLQQASAKQNLVQRRHELKKKLREDEKRQEVEELRERKKKASIHLKDLKKASEKRKREYMGTVQYPSPISVAETKQKTETKQQSPETNRNGSKLASMASTGTLTSKQSSTSNKGKQKIIPPCPPPSSSFSSTSSSLLKYSKPSSSVASSSKPSKPKAPVDFKELMKLAEKKTQEVTDKDRAKNVPGPSKAGVIGSSSEKRLKNEYRGEREGSPLGKQLLEKGTKRKKTPVSTGKRDGGRGGGEGSSGAGVGGDSRVGCRSPIGGARRETTAEDRSSVGGNVRPSSQAKAVFTGRGRIVLGQGGGVEQRGKAVPSVGEVEGSSGVGRGGRKVEELPESARLMRERARRQLEASSMLGRMNGSSTRNAKPSAATKSFYGGTHAQLSKEGRPQFLSKPVSRPYQNSWVSELSGCMQRMREEAEMDEGWSEGEQEEEEDLKDFVVDDVEEGEDYSSAIRELFGYDKRRFHDEEFDDRMMESSFAQQQFEEMRSSRLGWLEDQEDMKKEAEEVAQKRRKRMGGPSGAPGSRGKGLKQSKLSYR